MSYRLERIFLDWNNLITLSQNVAETRRVTRSDSLTEKKEITSKVYNSLTQYTFGLYQKELGCSHYITGDARDKAVTNLTTYLTQPKGDPLLFDPLIQEIKTAHSKEVDFRTKAFKLFKRLVIVKTSMSRKLCEEFLVANSKPKR
jgi:hypothetical protein